MSSSAMEQFVMNVRTLSGQGNFNDLNDFLQKHMDVLVRNPTQLATAMETLDLQQHSLGVLAILSARLQQPQIGDWDDLFSRISLFILECNGEQIRYAAQSFAELCHLLADQLMQRSTPLIGISPLSKAVSKLQLTETTLTSVHADVARLALASKCFTGPVLNLITETDFNDYAKEAAADPKHILLFFYYAGMIAAAIKNFERALYYLEACVTVPSVAVSHVMLEANKKYVLIWLIVHGDMNKDSLCFPRYTSHIVNKYIRPLCSPYYDVVNAFYASQPEELEGVINKYSDVFATDSNTGLVAQVVVARRKTSIKRLTKTFLTLSLADVAARVGLGSQKEAEHQLVAMVEEGSIHARISQKDGMVRFDTNPERYDSVKMLRKLEADIINCIDLDRHITTMEEEIMLNPQYIKKFGSQSGSAAGGGSATVRAAASAELDDEALGGSSSSLRPSSATGSTGGTVSSAGPSSSTNANNVNSFGSNAS